MKIYIVTKEEAESFYRDAIPQICEVFGSFKCAEEYIFKQFGHPVKRGEPGTFQFGYRNQNSEYVFDIIEKELKMEP